MKRIIQDQLRQEFVTKSSFGSAFHPAMALVIWLLFYNLNDHGLLWSLSVLAAGSAGGWRFLNRGAAKTEADKKRQYLTHSVLILFGALTWGGLAANSVSSYGLYSLESLTFCFIICTLLSSSIATVSPNLPVHRVYILAMILPPLVLISSEATGRIELAISALFAGFGVYLLVISHYQHKTLVKFLEYKNTMLLDKERLQQVVNSVPGFVFSLSKEMQLLEFSVGLDIRLSDTFKFDPEKSLHIDQTSQLFQEIRTFINSKIVSSTHEMQLHENGTPCWYLISMTKNTQINGATVIVGIPINELKFAQEQLKLQTSKAEYSARLATLGEMAGGIAHEINNPLAVIMGNATQINRYLDSDPIQKDLTKEKTQKIIQTCLRISKIVQGLRQFSRQGDTDPFAPTSIQQVISDTLELCRERFYRYGVNVLTEAIPDSILIPARAVQISQVILNIMNNAFDAMNEQTGNDNKFVQLRYKKDATHFSIFISDSGPGIPEQVAKKIFEPFFTTKEVGKGTGLGLSISKGIIEDHQGELILHREEPLTTFEIKLPLKRKEKSEDSSTDRRAA